MITKYLQTGLITNFTEFYEEIQDNSLANLQEFLSIICDTPGVKVIDEEFECRVERGVLKVDIGQAIFPNYTPFFPGSERHVELDLAGISQSNEYEVVFQLTDDGASESHPYPFVPIGDPDPAETPQSMRHYSMQYRAARIIVRDPADPGTDTLQLAMLSYDDGWVIEDKRIKIEMVKLLSFDSHSEPNLDATSTNLSKLRHVPEGRTNKTTNHQSDITNIAYGSRAIVSWDPTDAAGFYIVRLHHVDASELISQSQLVFHYGGTERIYTSIPCANGIDYTAKLFYSPILINPQFTNIGEAEFIGGTQNQTESITVSSVVLGISYLYNTSRIIKIIPEIPEGAELMKVYICDLHDGETQDSFPSSPYLYKEMSPGELVYFASEDSVEIIIKVRFYDDGQQMVGQTGEQTITLSQDAMDSEQMIIPIYIPDDDEDAAGDETVYEMTAWRSFVIDRIRVVGTGLSQSSDNTLSLKDEDGDVKYAVDFDEYNNGVKVFPNAASLNLHLFEEGDEIEFTIDDGGDLRGSTIYLTVRVVE